MPEDLEEFQLYIDKNRVLRPNNSHGRVQMLLLLLPPPPLDLKESHGEETELLLHQTYSSFTPINQPESFLIFSSTPASSCVSAPSAAFIPMAHASFIPAGSAPVFNAPFSEFLSSVLLLLISIDSNRLFPLSSTVENKIEPLFTSASPESESAPEFIDFTDKPANFTELDWKILGEATSDLSFESSLETAGLSQKRKREEKDKAEENKRKREVRNDNPVESEFLISSAKKVGTVVDKLPKRETMTPAPRDEDKTMAMMTSKDKAKKKVKITKQKKEPKCGCKAAVGKKWKESVEGKKPMAFPKAWNFLFMTHNLDLVCFTHQRQLAAKLGFWSIDNGKDLTAALTKVFDKRLSTGYAGLKTNSKTRELFKLFYRLRGSAKKGKNKTLPIKNRPNRDCGCFEEVEKR